MPVSTDREQKIGLLRPRAHHGWASRKRKNFAPPFRCYRCVPCEQPEGLSFETTRQDNYRANQGQENPPTLKNLTLAALGQSSQASRIANPHAFLSGETRNSQRHNKLNQLQAIARTPPLQETFAIVWHPRRSSGDPRHSSGASQRLPNRRHHVLLRSRPGVHHLAGRVHHHDERGGGHVVGASP